MKLNDIFDKYEYCFKIKLLEQVMFFGIKFDECIFVSNEEGLKEFFDKKNDPEQLLFTKTNIFFTLKYLHLNMSIPIIEILKL